MAKFGTLQLFEHPSLSILFASSQSYKLSTTPLPHNEHPSASQIKSPYIIQKGSHPSFLLLLPSSHYSPESKSPLPQLPVIVQVDEQNGLLS